MCLSILAFGCVHLPPFCEIQGRQAVAVGHGHIGPGLQERPADAKPAGGDPKSTGESLRYHGFSVENGDLSWIFDGKW